MRTKLTLRRFKYTIRPSSIKHQGDRRLELSEVRNLPSVAGRQRKHSHFREDNQGRRPLAGGDFGKYAPALTVLFGEQEHTDWNKEDIDWNAIDSQLISQRIVVTRPELNGKKLGSLHLRNHYGINISRVYRSGVQLLATAELTLQLGDRLTVVGEAAAIQNVEKCWEMPSRA